MRVLMLHNRYLVPGGEDQSTSAEAALLSDYGHSIELLEHDNREIEHIGKSRTALRTLWSSESYRRVREKLSTGHYDILHVQNFSPLWSPSVYYAASRCGVPVVQTLRNYRLLCVNSLFFRDGHVCEDCLAKFVPWHGIVHGCYRESRAGSAVLASMVGVHKLLKTWKSKVQVYIALTEFARAKYIAGGLPADKIVVKSNFIHPSPIPGSGGGGYALYVGRLAPEKGIATLLDAWDAAANPMPLKILGEGPLRDFVISRCRTGHIEYVGGKPLPEALEMMRCADLLVFPSEWYETMGRTIIEAFAVGTPVLASNIGPPASMVVHGKTGFHFPAGDGVALRRQVEWCSRNLQEVQALRKNARAAFEEKYTGAANIEMLLAVYRKAQGQLPRQSTAAI